MCSPRAGVSRHSWARLAAPEQAQQLGLAYVGRPGQDIEIQLPVLRQPLQQHTGALTLSHTCRSAR
ncbi:hypothetical protein [Streptomyces sp. NPDC002088]|uniref:hypothetical protein n=1 Tax=Streptomyces sp. NPDC002088 TaxID=3154665 RepID=UPI0033293C79